MEWETQLISIYLTVCGFWKQGLSMAAERMSPNGRPDFTDEEVIAIYIFGILQNSRKVKDIHSYCSKHFAAWFPGLPEYKAYCKRLNQISDAFPVLVEMILAKISTDYLTKGQVDLIADSLPIMIAKGKRSSSAKVATGVADQGYCATKNEYYHGVKLHLFGIRGAGTIPLPCEIGVTAGSCHDLTAFKEISTEFIGCNMYLDKAYADQALSDELRREQYVSLHTPVKLKRGQKYLTLFDQIKSEQVSRKRQPIESLFSWLAEKTGINNASKVRSIKGLTYSVFGKLAAGLMLMLGYLQCESY